MGRVNLTSGDKQVLALSSSALFFLSLHSKLLAQSPASEPPGPKLVGLKEEEKKSEQCFIHPCKGEDAGEELSSPVSCSHLQLPLMSRVDSFQAPHFGPKGADWKSNSHQRCGSSGKGNRALLPPPSAPLHVPGGMVCQPSAQSPAGFVVKKQLRHL